MTEKALHRLVVVGVVEDYTVDYSARSFSVVVAKAGRDSVIDKYCDYIASYQRSRAEHERRKSEALTQDWDGFVLGVATLYVQFVYDVIERGQRRAIAEMLAACQSGSGDELRERILNYLTVGESSEAVEAILSDARSGVGVIAGVLAGIASPNDAALLRGSAGRSLETYPDHPGLLLLRAATEALSRDADDQTITENFEAFLSSAVETYGLTENEIATATGAILRVMSRNNSEAQGLIEQTLVSHIHSRDALRLLVAEAGITAVPLSPWILLDDLSSGIECCAL